MKFYTKKSQPDFHKLEFQINKYCSEFKRQEVANLDMTTNDRSRLEATNQTPLWIPPPAGLLKLNCDASWCAIRDRGGIGWILRSPMGSIICAGYKNIQKRWKVSWLEALAVGEGIKNIPVDSPQVRVETDSLAVVRLVSGEGDDAMELGIFTEEVKSLVSSRPIESVVYVPRCHNEMTHKLAQQTCVINACEVWMDSFTSCVLALNSNDNGYVYHTCGGSCPTGNISSGAVF